jgi:threonine/homoserine/homoserine lactone efflux protein
MPDASTLLLFTGASLALLAIPGPAVIYVVTRSIAQGRRAGVVSVLGIETGTFVYAVAAALGLTGLIAASETGFAVVKYAGAAYLVYLGLKKLFGTEDLSGDGPATGGSRLFLTGMMIQLLNPKIAIFFLAFLPQFVDASGGPVALQIFVLGTLFTLLAVVTDGSYALLAGTAGRWLRGSRKAGNRIAKVSGGVYIGLGVSAALSGQGHAATATQP